MTNNLNLLYHIVNGILKRAGIECLVFGGWANELTGAIVPRPHGDIDLLYVGNNFDKVDAFLLQHPNLEEIRGKRFPHKRAFLCHGVMVEILLVSKKDGCFVTDFWNEYKLKWPNLTSGQISPTGKMIFPVCDASVVDYYHRQEKLIAEVRARHIR